MSQDIDKLDAETQDGVRSPVSGLHAAVAAGEAVEAQGVAVLARSRFELPAYLWVQACWFAGFGLQMVLFPYLTANVLQQDARALGIAQMSLSAPSLALLLFGGALAERADGRRLLITLHVLAALPPLALAGVVASGALMFWMLPVYGLVMGSIGAFMMPARDAILTAVVQRRVEAGSGMTMQQGVALAAIAQFAAQVAGLLAGGLASTLGPDKLIAVQGIVMGLGAAAALWLQRGRPVPASGAPAGVRGALAAVADGLRIVRADPALLSMVLTMFAVGIFIIGSFLVVLPILARDSYAGGASTLTLIFVAFWGGAFVSSVVLSRLKAARWPGRTLLIAQFLGAGCILAIFIKPPFHVFLAVVVAWGLLAGVAMTMSRSIVQERAPKSHIARVLSIYQLGFMGGAPIGALVMGVCTRAFGPHHAALVPAIGMMVLVLFNIVATPIWRLTRKDGAIIVRARR